MNSQNIPGKYAASPTIEAGQEQFQLMQSYTTGGMSVSSWDAQTGGQIISEQGLPAGCYRDPVKINELTGVMQPYKVIRLDTDNLTENQLFIPSGGAIAKISFTAQGGCGVIQDAKNPASGRSGGHAELRSCLYAKGLAAGYVLFTSYLDEETGQFTFSSLLVGQGDQLDQNNAQSMIDFGVVGLSTDRFYSYLAINRQYTDEDSAKSIIANVTTALHAVGLDSTKLTAYQSYGLQGYKALALGLDSKGQWGETLSEV